MTAAFLLYDAARGWGLTPAEFEMIERDDQVNMIAFLRVSRKLKREAAKKGKR